MIASDRTSPSLPGDPTLAILDTIFRLPSGLVPTSLVPVSRAGVDGASVVRSDVVPALRSLGAALHSSTGRRLRVVSAYRSYWQQAAAFSYWTATSGRAAALRYSARPGHSEHQLGTALDVSTVGERDPWQLRDWGATAAGRWVAANAWRYGFALSYPRGREETACYGYEPWHLRYVGREAASAVHRSGFTLREWLWARIRP